MEVTFPCITIELLLWHDDTGTHHVKIIDKPPSFCYHFSILARKLVCLAGIWVVSMQRLAHFIWVKLYLMPLRRTNTTQTNPLLPEDIHVIFTISPFCPGWPWKGKRVWYHDRIRPKHCIYTSPCCGWSFHFAYSWNQGRHNVVST